jgi:hypothetical protein
MRLLMKVGGFTRGGFFNTGHGGRAQWLRFARMRVASVIDGIGSFRDRGATRRSRHMLVALIGLGLTGQAPAQTNSAPNNDFLLQRAVAAQAAATAAQALFQTTNSAGAAVAVASPLALSAPQAAVVSGQVEQIAIQPYGASASFGPHKVAFATDLTTDLSASGPAGAGGSVDLMMAGGAHLRSKIQGLAFYVPGGPSVMIAQLKSSQGELISSNQILYSDSFDSIRADVLYTYTKDSLEQDIIIRANLPSPTNWPALASPAGGASSQVQLAVISEFLDPPQPNVIPDPVDISELNAAAGIQGDSILNDQTLIFSTMRMSRGRAFILGNTGESIPVYKTWTSLNLDQRWFLVESTPYLLLKPQLDQLPPYTGSLNPGNSRCASDQFMRGN